MFSRTDRSATMPLCLRSRAEPKAELQRIGGIVELRGFAIDADVARVAHVEREQQARELGASRA
jgi:hypothetical protein